LEQRSDTKSRLITPFLKRTAPGTDFAEELTRGNKEIKGVIDVDLA
jgi:hypothetical protein